jgi:hypothetical protein
MFTKCKNLMGHFQNKGDVTHCGLAIYIEKYLKAKDESWKLSNISP